VVVVVVVVVVVTIDMFLDALAFQDVFAEQLTSHEYVPRESAVETISVRVLFIVVALLPFCEPFSSSTQSYEEFIPIAQ
jgi:hypothetical protein